MKYISLFSGIEAATVAWEPLGWEPIAFCEIDDFPSAVLNYRFPNVPNFGDITKIDWSVYNGSVDVVVGGSPCQSFSIAGRREGLAGESGLMFEYIRAVQEIMPRYFIWENVQGALSSEGGAAFGQLLSEMDALGYGLCWRVLDAQFFGVPQRRERVFLVGCLGGAERSAEILFERESLCWDFAQGREKRKALASEIERGAGGCAEVGAYGIDHVITTGGNCTAQGPCVYEEIQATLKASGAHSVAYDPKAYTLKIRSGCEGGGKGALIQEDMSATLATGNDQTLFVAEDMIGSQEVYENHPQDSRVKGPLEVAPTVHAKYGTVGGNVPLVRNIMQVRKLTPKECERLQGFPDDWTKIPYKGKDADSCPDTKRYKAIGNSMAVPVMRWIGERIDKQFKQNI